MFSKEGDPISSTSLVEHEIYTEGPPVRLPFRRQNPLVRAQEQSQVKEMLRDGVIRSSISPWASPVVMVKKKDGSMRFCVDFRKVNDATIKDAHPLPRIDDTLESLHGAKFFSTLDLKSGYWQVPIREQDKEKTAFRTCSGQLYEFNQLPFGLCNAPATFSRLMDRALAGLAWNICLYYLDDIIVFSASWEEHLERLRAVFERLRRANLKLGAAKCHLARREVSFLGYKVTPEGLEPEPKLMEAIDKLTPPTSVTEVRSFLGLVGYYRRFIKRFSDKAAPLNALLHKEQEWSWTPQCQEAFDLLKGEISRKPVSAYLDFNKPFRLYTDASNLGLGAILAQYQEGKERIICCASRTLNNAETNYSTTKKECLAIVWGVHMFRPFLMATQFEILTDHYALQWLRTMKNESALLHRWAASLEDYRFTILHRPGKLQGHVDGLSRLPLESPTFTLEGKIQVREEEAEEVIKGVHRQGHLGEHKTWKAFNRKFITAEGRKKCREIVRTCPECQLGKDYKQRHLPKGTIESSKPWDVVSIDIMGPFPYDDKAKRFIVTMMDVHSRYIMAIPVQNHTAQTVSKCLYEHVMAYFGVPRSILSDRGAEFTSSVWESLTQILGSNIRMASPYYPQGNAVIERSHRTLNNMLRTMLLEKRGQGWSTLLPSIMLYMNSMIQEQTGVSACEILFGQNPNLPSDLSFAPATPVMEDREGYVKQLKRELGDMTAKLSRILGQERNQEENPFSVGERVVITILPSENRNKLLAKWKGPFTITKIPNRFQIEYLEDGVRRTTHISYAKKFHERSLNIRAKRLRHRLSRGSTVITMASLQLSSGSGKSRRRRKVSSFAEIRRRWKRFSGSIGVKVYGPKEELCEELQKVVEAAGAAEVIDGGELWDLCGQRSKEEGGSCDASFVPSAIQIFALSQEEESQAPAEQVRNECQNQIMAIPSETSLRFKSLNSYHANDTYLASFQTKSEASPELLTLVRKISKKERPRGKQHQQFVFRYGIQTVVEKQPHRPSRFKLAYVENTRKKDKLGFGPKSCKKAKNYYKKTEGRFWNPYVYIIMCIFMIYIYLRKQVSKWQPVAMPSITSGFNEIYEKVKMAPETCPRGRKHNNKSNNNFWYMYAYVKTYICMICIYLTEQVNRLKLVRLHTRASDSAKIYTIDKFGTKSSPMARKRIHKFHNILWNAYCYLKRRIMGFDRYLHTRILSWRNQKPLATPPPEWCI